MRSANLKRYTSHIAAIACILLASNAIGETRVLLIVGLAGDHEQDSRYDQELRGWQKVFAAIGIADEYLTTIREQEPDVERQSIRDRVLVHFADWNKTLTSEDNAIIVLVGYGVSRHDDYQFQIRGPRLSGKDLALGMSGQANSYFLIATGPGAGSLTRTLAGERRVILTATAEETEINQTQFGRCLIEEAAAHPDDSITRLLTETEDRVSDYYKSRSLARTEHATIAIGTTKPIEAPFETGLTPEIAKTWTLSTPGGWLKESVVKESGGKAGTNTATQPSKVER